jgi:hypothetical protein
MKERTLKEIEDEMDATVPTGNVGKVMDLVDEHGNTFDKMFYAIEEGNLERVIELEALGIDITEKRFISVAIKHDQELILFHQISQGASVDDVIDLAKEHEKDFILQWAELFKRSKIGSKK